MYRERTKEKTKLNYFFIRTLIIITHIILLANVYLNGTYDDVFEIIKLSTAVVASDLIYFIILGTTDQDTYTVDYLLILIMNISLIFQSCFGGVVFNLKHFITLTAGMIACHVGYLFTRNSYKAEKIRPYCYAGIAVLMVVIVANDSFFFMLKLPFFNKVYSMK